MSRRVWALLFALCLGLGAVGEARAEGKCGLTEAAEFDLSTDLSGRVSIPMTIGGHTVKLMVDTAGFVSTLTQHTVKSLGLSWVTQSREGDTYYDGELLKHYLTLHDVMLGRLKTSSIMFFVMSDGISTYDVDGMLAPDMLSAYDADFDFANSKFRLFNQDHCEGQVVYWTRQPYGVVSFHPDTLHHVVVPVLLDGKELSAVIDTGAASTVASLNQIEEKFDLNEMSPGMAILPGGSGVSSHYHYPFKTLTFDDVTVSNPDIALGYVYQSLNRPPDQTIVLGMNVLRRLHIYIAYGERKLYVTPATAH
jgi:predicted aspartyl protease